MQLVLPEGEFDGYIFDCDGTLADTMPLHYAAWRQAISVHHCHFPEELFYRLGGMQTHKIINVLNEVNQSNMPPEETVRVKEVAFLEMLPRVKEIPATVHLARKWFGKFPMAVASGGLYSLVSATLDSLGIRSLFNTIVTAEDVQNGKPAPDTFLLAAERLGVRPERCLVFEDTPTGVAAARAAGMPYVIVPSNPKVNFNVASGSL